MSTFSKEAPPSYFSIFVPCSLSLLPFSTIAAPMGPTLIKQQDAPGTVLVSVLG